MIPFSTQGEDSSPESPVQKLIQGALGKAIILDSAPTQANNSVPEGELAFFGTKIYWKLSGTLYEFSISATA